jgi:hypothetical protein
MNPNWLLTSSQLTKWSSSNTLTSNRWPAHDSCDMFSKALCGVSFQQHMYTTTSPKPGINGACIWARELGVATSERRTYLCSVRLHRTHGLPGGKSVVERIDGADDARHLGRTSGFESSWANKRRRNCTVSGKAANVGPG